MSSRETSSERPYGGIPAAERRAERRERLVEAAIEIVGTDGLGALTVRRICRSACLNERYYYELFGSREEALGAAYEEVVGRASRAVLAALADRSRPGEERIRSALDAFVRTLDDDRRLARIQLFEVVGVSEELERRRRGVMAMFAALVRSTAIEVEPRLAALPERSQRAVTMMFVGGVNELLIDWMLGALDCTREELVAEMTSVARALLRGLR
jgi:AcrR family transcriptional regulator